MTPAVLSPNNALNALNLLNPIAPPVYGGLTTPDGSVDFTYPYDVTLTANQTLTDVIKTNTDADFQLTAMIINVYTSIQFSIQRNINGVYFLEASGVLAGNWAGDPSSPPPVMGKLIIPRGADLNIQLVELSGASNTIEILFRGLKLFGGGSRSSAPTPSGASGVPIGLGGRYR